MNDSPATEALAERVRAAFSQLHGDPRPEVWFAPGRVNLVGAHLDYSGGDVLPVTVELGVCIAIRPRADRRVRLGSLDQPERVDLDLSSLGASKDPAHAWAAYPLGVSHMLGERLGDRGFDAVFAGNLPMASGMSSSAAIEVATAFALNDVFELGLPPRELALVCHAAETRFVGVQCGIMDQFASALGRAGHALLLHCADASHEHVAIHGGGFQILVMDTKKPRTLASVAFNERVQQCRAALDVLRREVGWRDHLALYTVADFERVRDRLEPILQKRVRHVVSEMQRVAAAVAALTSGDAVALGAALDQSHRSAALDYEVSCDELDVITDAARACPEVFGARLTGAGFGGCAIALIRPGSANAVTEPVGRVFRDRFGVEPGFSVLRAGGGPRPIAAG
jgi:galactokinase